MILNTLFQFLEIQQNGTLEIRQSNPFELLFYYFSYIASAFYFICFFLLLISLLVAPITDTKARIVLIIYSFLILYIGIVILRMSLPLYCARKIKKEMEYIRKNYHEKIPYNQDLKVNKKPKLLSEEEKEIAKKRFESHFGEIESTDPTNINNETIDADLAQEYSSNNQED